MREMRNFKRVIGLCAAVIMLAACGEEGESDAGAVSEVTAVNTESTDAATTATAAASEVQDTVSEAISGDFITDITYGDPNAPIEIIEYASMTCPHCASFSASIFPQVKENFIDTGKAKFIFRNLVVNRLDLAAAATARCTNQDVARELIKVYFAKQQEWGRSDDPIGALAGLARRAGVSRTQFDRCLANTDLHQALVKMGQDGAKEYNITGTPTIIVNGTPLDNYGYETIEKAVNEAG